MLLILLVSLYTSRVILKVLGVDDFGISQTVCGVVTFLAFLSNALASGTSRFVTFEMGKEKSQLDILFATVRLAHIILGVVIFIAGEPVGIWFIKNKLVIPPERLTAATFAFHFSMITTFFQITQVPYNAMIIAYERMNVYAYVSIAEAVFKLVIVFMLQLIAFDKLEVYAVLTCAVTVLIMLIYRIYCRRNFTEVKAKLTFNKDIFKSVAAFSSWSLIGSSAASFANHGVTIVTSMFFSPAIVTVRSLALRVNNLVNQFISNFRTAINPQVVKKYAAGDLEGSKNLLLASTKYTYFLTLLIVLPLYLLVEPALKIWLGEIPDGTIPFVKLALVQGLFQAFDVSLYIAIYAKGQIKENAILSPLFDFIQLPVVYVLFILGFPPITLAWVETFACVGLGIVMKPLLVHFIAKYKLSEVYKIIGKCFLITVLASVLPVILALKVNRNSVVGFLSVLLLSVISTMIFVWFLGIDKETKILVKVWLQRKLKRQ